MASERKLAANRRNARRSTGPRTPAGKAAVRYNALQHGLLAQEVVITTGDGREDPEEFRCLHSAFVDDLQPVGPLEHMLVEKIVVCYWRLRRVLRVETAEIRRRYGVPASEGAAPPAAGLPPLAAFGTLPYGASEILQRSAAGIRHLLQVLADVRLVVQAAGHLTESARDRLTTAFGSEEGTVGRTCCLYSYLITDREELEEEHPGLSTDGWTPEECQQMILNALDEEHRRLASLTDQVAHRESLERDLRTACLALPPPDAADTLLRYETTLDRQLYKAIAELERLQRRRRGDPVPPPVNVEVSHN